MIEKLYYYLLLPSLYVIRICLIGASKDAVRKAIGSEKRMRSSRMLSQCSGG